MKRESGYYWVKEYEDLEWVISYFNNRNNTWMNYYNEVYDNYWELIDETKIERK